MNLKRVRSLLVAILPLSLPLFPACNAPSDAAGEGADPGEGSVGVAAQAQVAVRTGLNSLAGGNLGSIVLMSDGTAWSCGDNANGTLGDGTTTSALTPVEVQLSDFTAVSEGQSSYSLALRPDGTLSAWGDNSWGQLGDGTGTDRLAPVPVLGPSGVTAMSAAYLHGLAVTSDGVTPDGTVWAWGINSNGQLGEATTTYNRRTPAPVSGLSGATAVAGGNHHSLAVMWDGTVQAWGGNSLGQLGDGTTTSRYTPAPVSGLSSVIAVAAGYNSSLALTWHGTVYAWGLNTHGELGDGTTTTRSTPVQVQAKQPDGTLAPLTDVTAVAEGYESSYALTSDGTVWAWGGNGSGQLGDETTVDRHAAVQVHLPAGSDVTAVAAGTGHAMAQRSGGTVWVWGSNVSGRLCDGTTTDRHTPVRMALPCAALDACHVAGVFDPSTGACSNPIKADGTTCSDGNPCTQTDTCQAGACVGADLADDGASCGADQTCTSGVCVRPMPNPASTNLPNPASYTSQGGVVVDHVTGLAWEQSPPYGAGNVGQADATAHCDSLARAGFAGYGDWRLPTRIELISLVDDTIAEPNGLKPGPAIDPTAFPGASFAYGWTSSRVLESAHPDNAFRIGGSEGGTAYGLDSSLGAARCVRSDAATPVGQYTILAGGTPTGTVLDLGTGLTWQQAASSQTYTQSDATSYCHDNTPALPGSGWRLPSMKELQTLVNDGHVSPAVDPTAFPGTPFDVGYWTSTPVAWRSGYVWNVGFDFGTTTYHTVGSTYHVRCVK
jgi:alpha-tubulin suppressor-like RCC1 family protein